ncbi:HSP70-like protein [Citrus associated ampelovirus 2]|nr:HSP70-like protein [Citrus associated ampelovirus 2]
MELGIDFGTTFSTVCYGSVGEGEDSCLSLAGSVYIPTEIFLYEDGTYSIGNRGKSAFRNNEKGDLFLNPKRWVGCNVRNIHNYVKNLNYDKSKVRAVGNNGAELKGTDENSNTFVSITSLIAMFIRACMIEVEDIAKIKVTGVVCSVPAKYNSFKRSYLAVALKRLGVPLRALINEPTAAALFGLYNSGNSEGNVAIFDFGGGTFDVSYLTKMNSIASVVNSEGDNYLGGRDIDRKIKESIKKKLKGTVSETVLDLITADIKETISVNKHIDSHPILTSNGLEQIVYTIDELNRDSEPFIDRAINVFLKGVEAIKKGDTRPLKFLVILTGGSSALPLVTDKVRKLKEVSEVVFDLKTFRASVALGAKIYSDILSGKSDLRLVDSLSQTLSDEIMLGRSVVVFPKSCSIPNKNTISFSVGSNRNIDYGIFEGENPRTWMNELTFKSVDTRPSGDPNNATVVYELSIDGRLKLTVNGREQKNLFEPDPPDEKYLKLRYRKDSDKYLEESMKLYLKLIRVLHDSEITLEHIKENKGPFLDTEIEELYDLRVKKT